jgi:pre-mRNA-splicing helicase BRR2
LKQVPHFNDNIINKLKEIGNVETVFELLDLDDAVRDKVLNPLSPEEISDVALFCNAYPNVELSYDIDLDDGSVVVSGESVTVKVKLAREVDEDCDNDLLGKVVCPRYPTTTNEGKREGWWIIIGDPSKNNLLSIKRIALVKDTKVGYYFIYIYKLIIN